LHLCRGGKEHRINRKATSRSSKPVQNELPSQEVASEDH
jgi:hypothetical protein